MASKVGSLLASAEGNVNLSLVAASAEDRDTVFLDLRRRLNRDWAANTFDRIVDDAAARLGERVNAKAFRERRIGEWRKYLSTIPEDADAEAEMERIIDGEISDYFRSRLPIGTRELMDALGLDPGPGVKRAIEIAKRVFDSGVHDRTELIVRTRSEFQAEPAVL